MAQSDHGRLNVPPDVVPHRKPETAEIKPRAEKHKDLFQRLPTSVMRTPEGQHL